MDKIEQCNDWGITREQYKDWGRMWCVEIEERPRHLWPDKWTVSGIWTDEELAYNNAERRWDKEQKARGERYYAKHPEESRTGIKVLADGSTTIDMWDDYFRWHAMTPSWSLWKDGTWQKMLINDKHEHVGVYDSYEEAVATLAKNLHRAARYENYEQHLEDHINEHNDPYGD